MSLLKYSNKSGRTIHSGSFLEVKGKPIQTSSVFFFLDFSPILIFHLKINFSVLSTAFDQSAIASVNKLSSLGFSAKIFFMIIFFSFGYFTYNRLFLFFLFVSFYFLCFFDSFCFFLFLALLHLFYFLNSFL